MSKTFKQDIIKMLQRKNGATYAEIMDKLGCSRTWAEEAVRKLRTGIKVRKCSVDGEKRIASVIV